MKCLLVADLHYVLQQYDWMADVVDDYDVVVIGGDLLDVSGFVDGRVQIVVILKYLRRLLSHTRLLVCSGNHDLDARNDAGEKVARWMNRVRQLGIPTDGDSVTIGDTLFTICPWWDGPATRQQVGDQLARDFEKPKKSWIWVYHSPPDGSPTSLAGQRNFGDKDLTDWIETFGPDLVLTGHIHNAPFDPAGSWADKIGSSWVFNAGRQIGPVPTHIAINTEEREALWFSVEGSEAVQLDAPLERPFRKLTAPPEWLKS